MRQMTVSLSTPGDGATTTVYSPRASGKVHSVSYVPDGSAAYANTADFTITAERTGEAIVSRTNVSAGFTTYPRAPTADSAGVASLYAAGGEPVEDKIGLANDRIKIVVAQGGNSKTGKFIFLIDE